MGIAGAGGAVHVYVCMYVCMYACIYVCMYVCTYVYVCNSFMLVYAPYCRVCGLCNKDDDKLGGP